MRIKIILIVASVITSISVCGQKSVKQNSSPNNVIELKKTKAEITHSENGEKSFKKASSLKSEVESKKTDESVVRSDYARMEKKIIQVVKGNVIPDSVPKHQQGQSLEEYKVSLRNWTLNNRDLLTDEYLKKLEARKK